LRYSSHKKDTFKEVITPTLAKNNNCPIMISTPLGEDNFMTWLMSLKNPATLDGRPVESVTLNPACEPCVAAGTHDTCDHDVVVAPDAVAEASKRDEMPTFVQTSSPMDIN
jgi:hypothetical protein